MHGSMERQYTCALNELHFSEGDRARMTQKLLNAKQAKRPPHRHLRTALAAAAACAALTATALAAAPGIREALQARQGPGDRRRGLYRPGDRGPDRQRAVR